MQPNFFIRLRGGALIINDDSLVKKARYLINFGIENPKSTPELGTNAKMNEFEAVMGLCMLDEMENISKKRKAVYERYEKELKGLVEMPVKNPHSTQNYGYFTIVLKDEDQTLKIQKALNEKEIFPRRYFYPSLDTLSYIEPKQHSPISRDISNRILALPMYPELEEKDQMNIINIIKEN